MTASPDGSNALLAAVRARLLADPVLSAIVADRVFDRPGQDTDFPYVQIGDTQVLPFEALCVTGTTVYLTFHLWARDGWAGDQVRDMASALYASLHGQTFPINADYRLQLLEHQNLRVMRDPDGMTRHGVSDFRADITIDT